MGQIDLGPEALYPGFLGAPTKLSVALETLAQV